MRILGKRSLMLAAGMLITAAVSLAQSKPAPKEVFRDSDGNIVSNNEFVDIRMANFNYPDATIIKILDDGTKEFRLQKIPQEGMSAPDFKVRTLDGRSVALAELRGKVVVLSFWFIGCPACRNMEPKLNEFKARFAGDDVVFLAMTTDPKDALERYLKKERFDYDQVSDASAAMKNFAFRGFPKNIVIDKQGKIVYWRSTVKAWDKFESVVRAELAKN
ncbi:MAG TPA: TlpA disulfide reductase family protein [Pyrinomonadaceae bacterium]|nr:TlpA disulfide reductase family protein [Pyrinomonadaceae bacterium]